jgi:hypothetical protein
MPCRHFKDINILLLSLSPVLCCVYVWFVLAAAHRFSMVDADQQILYAALDTGGSLAFALVPILVNIVKGFAPDTHKCVYHICQ